MNRDIIDEYNSLICSKQAIILLGLEETRYGKYIESRINGLKKVIQKPKRIKKHKRRQKRRRGK